MNWSEQFSRTLIDYCRKYLSSKNICDSDTQLKKLGKRIYRVYNLTNYRIDLINFLYEKLIGTVKEKHLPIFIVISSSCKSLRIRTNAEKPFWYKVGLTLSDGAVLDRYRLIFSSSNKYTIDAILQSFYYIIIYPTYYMVSIDCSRTTCSYNFVVKEPEVVNTVYKIKNNEYYVIKVAEYLLNNYEYLVQFLAGIIDGDGSIDKDNIRISISSTDPIYMILNKIFENNVSYDKNKYLLRISTSELRKRNLIHGILNYLVIPNKRNRLNKIMKKKPRINIKITSFQENELDKVIESLDHNDYAVLLRFKYRLHGKYIYAYISVSSKNFDSLYRMVTNTFSRISSKIGVDISRTVKIGTREIIIYHQDVVKLIRTIQEAIKG